MRHPGVRLANTMPAWCAPRGACAYSEGLGVWGGAGGGGRGPCSGGGATCGLSYAFIGLQGCELDASDCPRVEICPLVSGTLQKAHASSEVVRKGSASIITVTTVPALLSAEQAPFTGRDAGSGWQTLRRP